MLCTSPEKTASTDSSPASSLPMVSSGGSSPAAFLLTYTESVRLKRVITEWTAWATTDGMDPEAKVG